MTDTSLPAPAEEGALVAAGETIARDRLVNRAGVRYRDFKRTLAPRYALAWAHLLAGHLALALTWAALAAAGDWLPAWAAALCAGAGAALFGYVFAYINLFFHEAAHFNLARGRRWNDRLANLFIGVLFSQDVRAYRAIHFDHHRYLGTPRDTERSYFEPLNARFFLELLTGVKALKVLLGRDRALRAEAPAGPRTRGYFSGMLLAGLALHGTLLGAALWLGQWTPALAWVAGMAVAYPLFGAVRQVLEHRDEQARNDVDYSRVPHGAYARLFGDGPLASTLGGAGFNRHLLHHWEPQVPYTRLRELEGFLLETELAGTVRARQSSYGRTFLRLLRSGR
jgi:fatty acid desaturase